MIEDSQSLGGFSPTLLHGDLGANEKNDNGEAAGSGGELGGNANGGTSHLTQPPLEPPAALEEKEVEPPKPEETVPSTIPEQKVERDIPSPVPPTQKPTVTPVPRDTEPEESDDDGMVEPPAKLSKAAADARLRRVFTPRADGTYAVPDDSVSMYKDLSTRANLMSMFEKCAYNPVTR